MQLTSYKDLTVWQKSFKLARLVYELTQQLPTSEKYGLCSQMRRSAISIPSNIAEGQQRNNRQEYRHFIGIAEGSAAELETQLLLVEDIYSIDTDSALSLLYEVQKMLKSLNSRLKA